MYDIIFNGLYEEIKKAKRIEEIETEGAKDDFQLYFKHCSKMHNPTVLKNLVLLSEKNELLELYKGLVKLSFILLYPHRISSDCKDSMTQKLTLEIRKSYSLLVMKWGQICPMNHPYHLGMFAFCIYAKNIAKDNQVSQRQLLDVYHAIHFTIFGIAASDSYIKQFLGKCFEVNKLTQLQYLRPTKIQKVENKNIFSDIPKAPQIPCQLKEIFQKNNRLLPIPSKALLKRKETLMEQPQLAKRFYFNVNQLSVSLQHSLKSKNIPLRNQHFVNIKERYNVQKKQFQLIRKIKKSFSNSNVVEKPTQTKLPEVQGVDDLIQFYKKKFPYRRISPSTYFRPYKFQQESQSEFSGFVHDAGSQSQNHTTNQRKFRQRNFNSTLKPQPSNNQVSQSSNTQANLQPQKRSQKSGEGQKRKSKVKKNNILERRNVIIKLQKQLQKTLNRPQSIRYL